MLPVLLAALLTVVSSAEADVVFCGGFIKSPTALPFNQVKVAVFSTDGIQKEVTECAPHGYFLLPIYSNGPVSIRVLPPQGWTFAPDHILLEIDGVTDSCSKGDDLNFEFRGFTVSGSVVSKGLQEGPTGVSVTLDSGSTQQHTTTRDGVFSLPNIHSGEYTVSLSHPTWRLENPSRTVTVGMGNLQLDTPFVVLSYNAHGSVHSAGQPIAGVELYLTPLDPANEGVVEGCISVQGGNKGSCKVTSNTHGEYSFSTLAPGSYKVVPHYQSEHSTFDVSPSLQVFTVTTDTVSIAEPFVVNGFAVIGRVLDAPEGSPLEGVTLHVNGEKIADTNSEGQYELTNVTSGRYEVAAKLRGYYFSNEILDISPNSPALPDIVASAYKLCGIVRMSAPPASALSLGQRKVGLRPSEDEESTTALVTTATDSTGAFCFKVSPGSYTLQALVGVQELKEGLRLTPAAHHVTISSSPIENVEFSQALATLTGTISCIEGDCSGVEITVAGSSTHTAQVEDNKWSVAGLLPGEYKVSVEQAQWCWVETEQTVTVETETESAPFTQSGFIMRLEVSHPAQLDFSLDETDWKAFELEAGTNRFCLKKPGVYTLVPKTCHKFEQEKYLYNTAEGEPVALTATKHLMQGYLEIEELGDEPVRVVISNLETHEKTTLEVTVEEDGRVKYQMWSPPNQKYLIKPRSETLLFTPPSVTVTATGATCPTVAPVFSGNPGIHVAGKVVPAVKGVLITLTSPNSPELKVTVITDSEGLYSIGPLHASSQYKVTAEKLDYDIVELEGSRDFHATKLSKLSVNVKQGEVVLGGVLVSVSSTKGYRNNVLLVKDSLVLSGLVPGNYFVRPIMKEYQFEPASQMLTIEEGLEVEQTFSAQRVAYSCYGKVTTLNGSPVAGVTVQAVATGECQLVEEGVTGVDGEYRIRGLTPDCSVSINVRVEKSEDIARASPKTRAVQQASEDSTGVNFIIFHEPTTFDITGYVEMSEEFISTTKVLLIEESKESGRKVHTSILDTSRLFTFPDVTLSSSYSIRLETSLSPSMYSYKLPEEKIPSTGTFQHKELAFSPVRRSVQQEQVTRASFTAVAVIVLSMVLAANHATLVPVFTQVYRSALNRGSSADLTSTSTDNSGYEYLEDVHKTGIKRTGKSRKR